MFLAGEAFYAHLNSEFWFPHLPPLPIADERKVWILVSEKATRKQNKA